MLAEKPTSILHDDFALALFETVVIVVGHFNFRISDEYTAFRIPEILNGPSHERRCPRGAHSQENLRGKGKMRVQVQNLPIAVAEALQHEQEHDDESAGATLWRALAMGRGTPKGWPRRRPCEVGHEHDCRTSDSAFKRSCHICRRPDKRFVQSPSAADLKNANTSSGTENWAVAMTDRRLNSRT
jgi:hypothetical protein